jgi:hypothetical protein
LCYRGTRRSQDKNQVHGWRAHGTIPNYETGCSFPVTARLLTD